MNRLTTLHVARLGGTLIFATAIYGCGSASQQALSQPHKIPENEAKASVAANIADLYKAAGLTPPTSVRPALETCDQYIQQRQQNYSVSATVVFPMRSHDEAKQAIIKVHDYMAAHGFSSVKLILNDINELAEGTIDGQNWGADYAPQGLAQSLRIDGGTGCNVIPDGTDTPPNAP